MKLKHVLAFIGVWIVGGILAGFGIGVVSPVTGADSWLTWALVWLVPPVVVLFIWERFGRKVEGAMG